MFLFTVLFLIFIYFEDPWLVADKISSKQEMYDYIQWLQAGLGGAKLITNPETYSLVKKRW